MCRRVSALILLVFVLGLALASVSEAALVGWWKFDDGSGTVAKDSSGMGNHGTVYNAPWVAGHYGGALSFEGTGYVDVPAASWAPIRTQATVSFWAYGDPAQQPQANFIFGAFSDPANNDARRMSAHVPWSDGTIYFDTGGPGYNRINKAGSATDYEGTWTFWTFLKNADTGDQQIYINGVLWHSGTGMTQTMEGVTKFTIGTKPSLAEGWYRGMIDDFRLYDEALSVEQILDAMAGRGGSPGMASDPVPATESTDIPRDVTLGWKPGEFAGTHNVYFGTVFDDVNTASVAEPKGVLVSEGQADATFDPEGLLEYGQTYYWRVDEVNATPDNTVFKGETWSFTAEPFAYPVTSAIAATASSSQVGMDPQNVVNGSGLDELDQHSTVATQMWMTNGAKPAWIQFEFAKVYKLDHMLVWNSNQLIESFLGFGAKTVTIEYSEDGATWATLEGVPEFGKATGMPTYTANTNVNFSGVLAKFVKLTIEANWGGVAPQTGLSEVRFFFVPVQAFEPQPAVAATGVSVETDLSWRPGREATSHQVFFGTDGDAVANGVVSAQTVTGHSYTPAGLMLGTEYFWKVDEVGDAGTYAGDVWSFTTEEFAVVDDFESYNDDVDTQTTIWHTWIDGLTDGKSGSQVGYDASPFAEKTIVHSGKQSMPITYNSGTFGFSEATRTFDSPQDWTLRGIKTLAVYFAGAADNSGQLYLKINSTKVAYDGAAVDLTRGVWQAWNIDLSTVGNVSSVRSLTIGIEGSGASGKLYIDDIRLYPRAPEYITPVDPGKTNLVALYTLDGNANDTSGKGNNGTVNGAEAWVEGMVGQALQFDGSSTYVDCGTGASLNLTDAITISAWIRMDFTAGDRKIAGNQDGTTGGYKFGLYTNNKIEFEVRTSANAGTLNRDATGGTVLQQGVWYHVTGVYSKGQFLRTYVYGNLDRETLTTALLGSSTGSFKLGREPMSASYYWLGALDDVKVYNRVLSQEEILWVMGQTEPVAKPF